MQLIHYLLTISLLLTAILIFISNNPVHSVLFLILCFFFSTAVLLMFGAEFLGLLFIMVYVGAVAVLFLFVVMMIETKKGVEQQTPFLKYFLIKLFTILFFIFVDYNLHNSFFNASGQHTLIDQFDFSIIQFDHLTNIELIAQSLFNNYNIAILIAGFILLVALIGCVCLTIPFKKKSKLNEQSQKQNARSSTIHIFKTSKYKLLK